jgi:hypothetical protein
VLAIIGHFAPSSLVAVTGGRFAMMVAISGVILFYAVGIPDGLNFVARSKLGFVHGAD